ncbi:hypothetical protein CQA66_08320 [Helicobacter aurati]|uniref:Uncharacterized protein n=1 Tax=Helicobacter aurati TaxID=137778 RepID=A0A3D8IZA7_9HELI|nr:hypothetical protein [Helicobacter aurati]RDU70403.1 hypothetical protein CQA66_08320 [Helicobacter aurati]
MTKGLSVACIILLIGLITMFKLFDSVNKELASEQYKNKHLEGLLDNQNKAIEKLKLDYKVYQENRNKEIIVTKNKYDVLTTKYRDKVIHVESNECKELKKKYLISKDILREFYNEKDK